MKTENSNQRSRLEHFRALYENALNYYQNELEMYDLYMNQYKGDLSIDGSDERAATVRNITYEIIETQVGSDIPAPKVDPYCYSERRERNAKSIERLLYAVRDRLPYELMNDIDERYTYIYGSSIWYAEWDNSIREGSQTGGIRVHCINPRNFIPQPNISSLSDMEYCFIRTTTTRDQLMRRYGAKEEDITLAQTEFYEGEDPSSSDTVTVILTFYKDSDGEIGSFIFSGDLVLSDIPKYYRRKICVCKKCGEERGNCRCVKGSFENVDEPFEEITQDIRLADGSVVSAASPLSRDGCIVYKDGMPIMAQTKIPYYVPRSFPIVIRKNISKDSSPFGQSDCEYIRPQQQAINKIETRILQKLLRSAITPIMPEDASVQVNNTVFGQVIRMKPGESANQYGKVDTTPNISQDIAEAERLYEHSKRILGISDALQGLDSSTNESGLSRQLKIAQATGRLESKKKMKHTAYAELDKIIFEMYLAFSDKPKELIYKDSWGRIHNARFNRYDFIEYDPVTGEYYYDDNYLFSVDLNGGAEYQREALWQRNLENLKAGTLGDPTDKSTLLRYWQCQERAHYPHARENVEYFRMATDSEKGEMNFDGE